jgi:hypothetical protein
MDLKINVFNSSPPISKLVELAKSYYDTGEIISEEYLDWQYNKNPFGMPYYSLAFDKDMIVGQYIVIPMKYRLSGSVINGSLSLNTLTHPNYQGKGLFIKMAKKTYDLCKDKNVLFTVGFPNPLSFGGFVKKLDFENLGYCNIKICVLRPLKVLFNQFKKKKDKHGGDIKINLKIKSQKSIDISNLNNSDSSLYTEFWNSISSQSNLYTIDKTWEYINWRYFEIPNRKYYVTKTMSNGKITSICAFRVEKVLGTNTAIIMDLLVRDGADNDVKGLLKELKRNLRNNNINLISIIQPNLENLNGILSKSFFFNIPKKILPQPIPFVFRQHNIDNPKGKEAYFSNWTLSFGDYDIF